MVVSKQSVETLENVEIKRYVASLEKKIDNALLNGTRNISLGDINYKLKSSVIKIISAKYQQVGWDIKHDTGYDQRDGDSWDNLIFS